MQVTLPAVGRAGGDEGKVHLPSTRTIPGTNIQQQQVGGALLVDSTEHIQASGTQQGEVATVLLGVSLRLELSRYLFPTSSLSPFCLDSKSARERGASCPPHGVPYDPAKDSTRKKDAQHDWQTASGLAR